MCSISGFIVTDLRADRNRIAKIYEEIIARSSERGKDSAGVVAVQIDGSSRRAIKVAPTNYNFIHSTITPKTCVVVGNNRAEPTTEFIAVKEAHDVQPFGDGPIFISHNGTIANDKELKAQYHLTPASKIDSAVLPPLIAHLGLREGLAQVKGSYALAIADTREPQKLWLACNYKSIYIQFVPAFGCYFFASRPEYLYQSLDFRERLSAPAVVGVPPYHLIEIIGQTGEIAMWELQPRIRNQRALVICSGGLDSTVAARWAQKEGYEITLLHFLYHCRAEKREMAAVEAIARNLGCDYRFESLSWLGKMGGSSLTDPSIPITCNETGAEFAYEWVPARNLIFIAMAAGLCDRFGFNSLVLGLNLEEGGAYPDNTVEFYQSLDHVCDIGTISRPSIICPLGNLVKHQIVRIGLEIEAPLHLSWSCYYGEEIHCGHCGPCFMRKNAFKMLGVADMMTYLE